MVSNKSDKTPLAASDSEGKGIKKFQRFIIWFNPTEKKVTKNQFHVEAENQDEALKILEQCAAFNYKVMGVSGYKLSAADKFIDRKFY